MTRPTIQRQNMGVNWKRTFFPKGGVRPNLELVFMEEWDKENSPTPWINGGIPLTRLLMRSQLKEALSYDGEGRDDTRRDDLFDGRDNRVEVFRIGRRENQIIATIIQWLGSNVGFAFLERCLRRAGWAVVRIPLTDEEKAEQMRRDREETERLLALRKNQGSRFEILKRKGKP